MYLDLSVLLKYYLRQREREKVLKMQCKKKSKTKSAVHGSIKVPAEIDYQCKAWHGRKVELNTSTSNQLGIFGQNQYALLSQRLFPGRLERAQLLGYTVPANHRQTGKHTTHE